jgi:hypothetical protein
MECGQQNALLTLADCMYTLLIAVHCYLHTVHRESKDIQIAMCVRMEMLWLTMHAHSRVRSLRASCLVCDTYMW